MKNHFFVYLGIAVTLFGCNGNSTQMDSSMKPTQIDVQGHRGCRGLLPENTIPAFIKAIDLGVTTLELDVVISKDKQVVVSHEPFLSHEMCLKPDGSEITKEEELDINMYQMTYAEIKAFDCGTREHTRFPQQAKMKVHKPLLHEMIAASEAHAKEKGVDIRYNIETKCQPQGDNVYHPEPDEFVNLVMQVIQEGGIDDRSTIQSFDIRTLQVMHEKYPGVELVLLIENALTPEENIERLGFVPEVYSPYFAMINDDLLGYVKEQKMKLIPWTVNEKEDIRAVLEKGVDGIISDYPDRVMEVLSEEEKGE